MKLPLIQGKRIILRQAEPSDADDIFAFTSDRSITQFLSWEPHLSVEETKKFLKFLIDSYNKKKNPSQWVICYKDTGLVIGITGFIMLDNFHNKAEIAYIMSANFAGMGLMTEANALVIEYGFNEIGLNRIQAKAEPENLGSKHVLAKLNFQLEGVFQDYLKIKGTYRTYEYYAILKSNYLG